MSQKRIKGLASVVIPAYNVESYIDECLDHLNVQTYPQIEIIVIDDASADQTCERIKIWQSHHRFPRFLLLSLPRNTGFSGAVTTGLFMAEGEYIAIQDADDYSHPERISRQVEFLKQRPDIDVVGTNYMAFNDRDRSKQTASNWLSYGDDIRKRYAKGDHCVSHPTILYRASVFDRIGGLTRKINGAEDYEFVAKCIQHDIGVENLHDTLYYYRSHTEQRSREFYS